MKVLIVIVAMLLGLYSCYGVAIPSVNIHYKLTLTVDDNGKQYTSSSVVEVFRQDTTKVFGGSFGGYGGEYKGEAVAVDLGEKGVLFCLLKGVEGSAGVDYPLYIVMHAFPEHFEEFRNVTGVSVVDAMRKLDSIRPRPKTNMPFEKLPMLVRFRDINDPETVELVDPNDLEKSFGNGVKLVSATMEITDEPVTKGVEKWLPWLWEYRNKLFDGNTIMTGDAKNRLANNLGAGAFSTEIYK